MSNYWHRGEEPTSGNHFTAHDLARLEGLVSAAAIRARCRTGTLRAAHVTAGGVRLFHRPGVTECSWEVRGRVLAEERFAQMLRDGIKVERTIGTDPEPEAA